MYPHDDHDDKLVTSVFDPEPLARRLTTFVDTAREKHAQEQRVAEQERQRVYQLLVDEHHQLVEYVLTKNILISSTPPPAESVHIEIEDAEHAVPTAPAATILKALIRRYYQRVRLKRLRERHTALIAELNERITEARRMRSIFTAFANEYPDFIETLAECYAIPDTQSNVVVGVIRCALGSTPDVPTGAALAPTGVQALPDALFAHVLLEWHDVLAKYPHVITALAWQTRHTPDAPACTAYIEFLRLFGPSFKPKEVADYTPRRWQFVDCQPITGVLPAEILFHHGYDAIQNNQSTTVTPKFTAHTSISFIQNTTKQNIGAPSEDVLLYAQHDGTLLVVVADGVSQSALGEIAAQQFAEQVYRQWKHLGVRGYTSQSVIHELLLPAAWVAAHSTRGYVAESIATIPDAVMRRIIERDNADAGSQCTFSIAVYDGATLTICWMGNTRILLDTGDETPEWLQSVNYVQSIYSPCSPADENFTNDRIRFSSHAGLTPVHRGLRGSPIAHECILPANKAFRLCILTDALEAHAADIFRTPIEKNISLERAVLTASAAKDDTTLIDIRIEHHT